MIFRIFIGALPQEHFHLFLFKLLLQLLLHPSNLLQLLLALYSSLPINHFSPLLLPFLEFYYFPLQVNNNILILFVIPHATLMTLYHSLQHLILTGRRMPPMESIGTHIGVYLPDVFVFHCVLGQVDRLQLLTLFETISQCLTSKVT